MTQHPAWRPDGMSIRDEYIELGLGTTEVYREGFTSTSSRGHALSSRIYYSDIKSVEILDWTRKFKTWYIVSVVDKKNRTHLFRTRYIAEAQEYLNALNVVIAHFTAAAEERNLNESSKNPPAEVSAHAQ